MSVRLREEFPLLVFSGLTLQTLSLVGCKGATWVGFSIPAFGEATVA